MPIVDADSPLIKRRGGGTIVSSDSPLIKRRLPWEVRAADWLPAVGQMVGEPLGIGAGALVPGLDVTGASEVALGAAGAAGGAAGGTELDNLVREYYGLPTRSVGTQAAIGAASVPVGRAIGRVVPLIGRGIKATRLGRAAAEAWKPAEDLVKQRIAELGAALSENPSIARMIQGDSSFNLLSAYRAAREKVLAPLRQAYEGLLSPHWDQETPNELATTLSRVEPRLALAGKSLRRAVREDIEAQPMTVRREWELRTILGDYERNLSPDKNAMARDALRELRNAANRDLDATIEGPGAAARRLSDLKLRVARGEALPGEAVELDYALRHGVDPVPNALAQKHALDVHWARAMDQFPERGLKGLATEPAAAQKMFLSDAAQGAERGRTLNIIDQLEKAGHGDTVRRAVATRIWQAADFGEGATPLERITKIRDVVEKAKPEIFDHIFGPGSRNLWLRAANATAEAQKELLANPTEADAMGAAIRDYLQKHTATHEIMHYLTHHASFTGIMLAAGLLGAGGYEFGGSEYAVGATAGALLGAGILGVYEHFATTPLAMRIYERAATAAAQGKGRLAGQLIGSAMHAFLARGGMDVFNRPKKRNER